MTTSSTTTTTTTQGANLVTLTADGFNQGWTLIDPKDVDANGALFESTETIIHAQDGTIYQTGDGTIVAVEGVFRFVGGGGGEGGGGGGGGGGGEAAGEAGTKAAEIGGVKEAEVNRRRRETKVKRQTEGELLVKRKTMRKGKGDKSVGKPAEGDVDKTEADLKEKRRKRSRKRKVEASRLSDGIGETADNHVKSAKKIKSEGSKKRTKEDQGRTSQHRIFRPKKKNKRTDR